MRGNPGDGVLLTAASGLVEHFFRREYGRLVAILTRKVGVRHVDLVEDAVQTALMTALTSWVAKSLPEDPGAWLYRVAHNHLVAALRNNAGRLRILEAAANELTVAADHPVGSGTNASGCGVVAEGSRRRDLHALSCGSRH